MSAGVPSLVEESWRLERFVPPFAFSAFFSPEDTLLCVCAADSALGLLSEARTGGDRHPTSVARPASNTGGESGGMRIAELTSGSGLVGLYLLGRDRDARLLGLDIDAAAARLAAKNARVLGLGDRAHFACADLWSASTLELLQKNRPQLLVCNPPYVPEPPGSRMQIEAGAGPHGTAHLLRALELTRLLQPEAIALSWCSLSDPRGIVAAAEGSGYQLQELYVTAIADGEYSGSVHSYLRELGDCFINEQSETLDIIASDGSARFAYLLFAGAFRRAASATARGGSAAIGDGFNANDARSNASGGSNANDATTSGRAGHSPAASSVERICQDFARDGVRTLATAQAPFALHCSVLTRWDELRLRVLLHGQVFPPRATA